MVTRIRQLLDWQQLSPTQFADLIGVGRPVVSHILSERNKPSLEVVQRIIAALPTISLPWLLSGTGEMLASASPAGPESPVAPAPAGAALPNSVSLPILAASAPVSPAPALPVVPAQPLAAPSGPAIRRAAAPVAPFPARFVAAKATDIPLATPVTSQTDSAPAVLTAPVPFVAALPTPPPPPEAIPLPVAPLPVGSAAAMAGPPLAAAEPVPAPPETPPAASLPTPDAALLPFLGEPGKAIRRIVIFYRDGSFADYQPEA